jgi:hypothetical protein
VEATETPFAHVGHLLTGEDTSTITNPRVMIYLALALCFIGAASAERMPALRPQAHVPLGLFEGSGLMHAVIKILP